MRLWRWVSGLTGLALFLTAAWARADRIPSSRVPSPPPATAPLRPDITVPYLTNNNSTLGVAQGVAPIIYSSPQVNNPQNPDVRRVYNLPFYGGIMGYGDRSNGAATRPPGPPLGLPNR